MDYINITILYFSIRSLKEGFYDVLANQKFLHKAEHFLNLRATLTTCQSVAIFNVKMLLKTFHYVILQSFYEAPWEKFALFSLFCLKDTVNHHTREFMSLFIMAARKLSLHFHPTSKTYKPLCYAFVKKRVYS